ncbi:MAG: hypothetical protein CMD07_04565 [Flavobacteriales bacterium]|nr:hypothetical protein [Flavobacteriales bacterium]MAJ98528.1 hypothetical protein [Flavobacteriales bacterium]|tara:strand:+ start:1503 stop:1892 length:390 start_codon:yes stop_codon:yes gene_type:complete
MSNLSTEGKLKRIHEEQIINERFKKREFVIETEEQYSQTLIFQLVQDKTNIIDNFKIGDKIEVYFNLRGREWQRDTDSEIRVFNTLDAWRIEKLTENDSITSEVNDQNIDATPTSENILKDEDEDDLPF